MPLTNPLPTHPHPQIARPRRIPISARTSPSTPVIATIPPRSQEIHTRRIRERELHFLIWVRGVGGLNGVRVGGALGGGCYSLRGGVHGC